MMRRILALAGILTLAALLAFPLRSAVYDAVIIPLAYVIWGLGLIYHSLSQSVWWVAVALLTLFIFGRSLAPNLQPPKRFVPKPAPPKGDVEHLASWIKKSDQGVYNKWLVANRLGKLAFQILEQRDNGKPRSLFEPLEGPGWLPDGELQNYLQAGLQGSFADFSGERKPFAPPPKTALDHDLEQVVEFLESQVENISLR